MNSSESFDQNSDPISGMTSIASVIGPEISRVRFMVAKHPNACSLRRVELLIGRPVILTLASVPADQRAKPGITDNLVRLSAGIEGVDEQIADLDQAIR